MASGAPWFMLVGGINGAGKSTFSQDPVSLLELVERSNAERIEVINPDTVTRSILVEKPNASEKEANLEAAERCEADVRARIERMEGHFVIETVLSSDKYFEIVERALDLGWNFLFVYVALPSVEVAVERVKYRVLHGGHDVPEAKIRKRWSGSLERMNWFWGQATTSILFLNTEREPRLVASKQAGETRLIHDVKASHALAGVLRATAEALRLEPTT